MNTHNLKPYNFPIIHYSSQSATSCYQECNRRYLYNYKLYGKGIVPNSLSIPLTTGSCIHTGIENIVTQYLANPKLELIDIDKAVQVAKEAYSEKVKEAGSIEGTEEQEFTFNEQSALTEALVRLWYEKELPVITKFYDIFAVEQEIEIELFPNSIYQSKPDLILIGKRNKELVNYSLKSAKRADDRLEKSYKVQMQAITEPYCTNEWIKQIKTYAQTALWNLDSIPFPNAKHKEIIAKVYQRYLDLPDKSSSTRFCYLIKGEWKNEEKDKHAPKIMRQDSPLIYGWRNFGPKDIRYAWSWFTPKAENKSGLGVLGREWDKFAVWEDAEIGGVKGWLELIKAGEKIQGDLGDGHIFDKYILSQSEVYVHPELLERRMKGIATIEQSISNKLQWLAKTTKEPLIDINVDTEFPMNTGSCFFPTPCSYLAICPNGNDMYKEHIANDPLNKEYGPMFKLRESHHEPERKYLENLKVERLNGY